jgi:phosphohistidine swiveling domain-containing protein
LKRKPLKPWGDAHVDLDLGLAVNAGFQNEEAEIQDNEAITLDQQCQRQG